jgi:peroxiredoxin
MLIYHDEMSYKDLQRLANRYERRFPTSRFNLRIEQWLQTAETLKPGKPAPGFTLQDTAGRQHSLKDYRGQWIYLSFWASWYPGCLRQAPAQRKLHRRLDRLAEPVKLINVSLDQDRATWRQTIREHELPGLHLYAPAHYDNPAVKAYGASGVPAYVLIGPEGNIVRKAFASPGHGAFKQLRHIMHQQE